MGRKIKISEQELETLLDGVAYMAARVALIAMNSGKEHKSVDDWLAEQLALSDQWKRMGKSKKNGISRSNLKVILPW